MGPVFYKQRVNLLANIPYIGEEQPALGPQDQQASVARMERSGMRGFVARSSRIPLRSIRATCPGYAG